MKLIFAFLFALLATWVYANPFGQEEDFNDYEIIKEERLEHEEAAVNDDDDDEEGDDDDDIDDNDDDDDDEDDDKMKCSRTLRKELGKCLKIDCRLLGMVRRCLTTVQDKCKPDDDTKTCIQKLPACMAKFCKPDDRKLGKPGKKCVRKFRKCVKKAEGSGMEL